MSWQHLIALIKHQEPLGQLSIINHWSQIYMVDDGAKSIVAQKSACQRTSQVCGCWFACFSWPIEVDINIPRGVDSHTPPSSFGQCALGKDGPWRKITCSGGTEDPLVVGECWLLPINPAISHQLMHHPLPSIKLYHSARHHPLQSKSNSCDSRFFGNKHIFLLVTIHH